ncbi:MAG TPA: hypothetical protein VFH43_06255, partial [Candidatus Kapabacteria bacterium]|nr:hypothetical protein [Candidatus Kapabacteria bacterium]
YLSSYNFGENANFRKSIVRPSRDFYPPFTFTPKHQHIWRVKGTAIVITAERDDQYELVTVNAVHPQRQIYLRYASLRNVSPETIRDIGISFEAEPDIPYPVAGHRSWIGPIDRHLLSERLEEMLPMERDFSQHYSENRQRYRFMTRGIIGGKHRGYQDLFVHRDKLEPGEAMIALHFLAPAFSESEEQSIYTARANESLLHSVGMGPMFDEIRQCWKEKLGLSATFASDRPEYDELIESNLIMQHCVERATGGYVVIDDYTGSWLRDHNGSHVLLLDHGLHEQVLQSMDRYYALDCSSGSLFSYYASDLEPKRPVPAEPDWSQVEGFVTGDVPNFRTQWYWWYFKHTGDLELVRERFNYMLGAFMRQKLHEHDYLASYCYDETYGIGPVGPMRTGLSADNSFNALAAAKRLTYFASELGRDDAGYLQEYAAKIHGAINEAFWLEDEGHYAMRRKPDGTIDTTPFSIGLLCPTWVDALDATDPKVISSVRTVLDKLYHKNGFIRLIPDHDQTVTMAIGYLIYALKKIRHPELDRALTDLLKWADPSGTFGEYLDERAQGPQQCYEHMAHRNRMWESGINTDSLFFALSGFDPFLYENRIALEPHLPEGWKDHSLTNLRVGESRLAMHSSRKAGMTTHILSGNFRHPVNIDLTVTARSAAPRINVNDRPVESNWQLNKLGVGHQTMRLSLEHSEPITVTVE